MYNEETELSPYEIYQLERWGNVLNNANPEEEPDKEFSFPRQEEIIYSLENPEQ